MCNLKLMTAVAVSALHRARHGLQEARESCTDGCTGHKDALKFGPRGVQEHPSRLQEASRGSKRRPRASKLGPQGAPERSKRLPRSSKLGPQGAQEAPRAAQDAPRGAQEAPSWAPKATKRAPRATKQQFKSSSAATTATLLKWFS